jgi:hypothetical protein
MPGGPPQKQNPIRSRMGFFGSWLTRRSVGLEFFVEFAGGTGDVHPARHTAFPVLDALHDAGWFRALRTVGALGGIHFLFTVACLRNLCHDLSNLLLLAIRVSASSACFTSHHSLRRVFEKKTKPRQQEMDGKFGPDTSQSSCRSLPTLVYMKPARPHYWRRISAPLLALVPVRGMI